jgi:serine/threonine protein kinase
MASIGGDAEADDPQLGRNAPSEVQDVADTFGLMPRRRPRSMLTDPLLGVDLGGVRIIRLVGEGGMGRVYEAWQEQPGRDVAVKVIRQGTSSDITLRRFEREAAFLAKLQHPGIAQVHVVGTYASDFGDVPFYVMEFIAEAKPITKHCFDSSMPLSDRVNLFAKVCDAVAHGHEQGVIHRDLKPGNLLVDSRGRPRVIDFGVARSVESDLTVTSMRTATGNLVGTVHYMSPEQFGANRDKLDPRADVYSLGVVLFELLTGSLPHEFGNKGIHEIARAVCETEPVRLRKLNAAIPRDVEAIAAKCLEKDRRDRYGSAGELAADLRRHLEGKPVVARKALGRWIYQLGRVLSDGRYARELALVGVMVVALAALVGGRLPYLLPSGGSRGVDPGLSSRGASEEMPVPWSGSAAVVPGSVSSPSPSPESRSPSPPIEQAMVLVQGGLLSGDSAVKTKSVDSFWISTHEVTNKEWREVQAYAEKNGYTLDAKARNTEDRQPVAEVSWYEAIVWCNAKSEMDQLRPAYLDAAGKTVYRRRDPYELPVWDAVASGYRLPTEAEWEWAASGGIKSHGFRFSGSDALDDVAWHPGNSRGRASSVGQKKPNELGLFDMTGNVREWCWSTLDEGPEPNNRVVRGGGWQWVELPKDFDVRQREYARRLDTMQHDLGFRIARNREP